MVKLNLSAKGPAADSLIAETRAAMEDIFGPDLDVSEVPSAPSPTAEPPQKDGAAVAAWIGVALIVPPAITASMDLVERSKLRQRLGKLIEKLRGKEDSRESDIVLKINNQSVNLIKSDADEVYDLLADQEKNVDE